MKKIDRLRKETYEEAMQLLSKKPHKCAIIRPTGFGKTGILTKVIKSGKYKKILYLYPTEVVKNTVFDFYYGTRKHKDQIPGVTFMTYMGLTGLSETVIKSLKGTDLIICDECHRLGATETMRAMYDLQKAYPKAHLLGATATPERMDMIDEIAMFFDDVCTSRYTLHNAFQDGVLQTPYYAFYTHGRTDADILSELDRDDMLKTEDLDVLGREYAKSLIKGRLIEIAELSGMDTTIRNALKQSKTPTNYQKYIVFFSNFSKMRANKAEVKQWFQKAFPKHTIRELIISTETSEYSNNVHKLESLTYKKGHIDLIYTCEMLNMGYHVGDLTGILMYRSTYSNTIYSQQLGRVLSSGDTIPKVVLDVVDNLHRKSVYSILSNAAVTNNNMSEEEFQEYKELVKQTQDMDSLGKPIKFTPEEQERFIVLSRIYKQYEDERKGKVNNNRIYASDLHLVVDMYEATYRELIAKTVAETISMRCRQAWNRWVEKGGDASVMSREHILSQHAPEAVPLDPFCRLKNVSVNAVLNEMGIA